MVFDHFVQILKSIDVALGLGTFIYKAYYKINKSNMQLLENLVK